MLSPRRNAQIRNPVSAHHAILSLPAVNQIEQPITKDDDFPVRPIYEHDNGKLLSYMRDLSPLEASLIEQGFDEDRVRERSHLVLQVLTRNKVRVVVDDEEALSVPSPRQVLEGLALKLPQPETFEPREMYADRQTEENAYEFLMRVWGKEVDERQLYQFQLKKFDEKLLKALRNMFGGRLDELASIVPTKSDFLDVAAMQFNPERAREVQQVARAAVLNATAGQLSPQDVREAERVTLAAWRMRTRAASLK